MTTTMDRWNPFREMLALQDVMDRMFEDTFYRSGTSAGDRASSFPIDLAETDLGFVLFATLPGVTPDQAQITIHGDTLTIRSLGSSQGDTTERNWIVRERRGGGYHRMVTLPAPVNPDLAEAHFKDGVLQLTLPKAEAARPRQIKVGSGPMAGTSNTSTTDAGHAPTPTEPVRVSAVNGHSAKETPAEAGGMGDQAGARQEAPDAADPTHTATGGTAAGTPTGHPANPPSTDPDKDTVTESSEESMAASDPPSWTQERT